MNRKSRLHNPAVFRRQLFWGWVAVLIWGVFVLGFDLFFADRIARQIVAGQTWQPVPGTITTSRIIQTRSSKGKSNYRPQVSYTYTVNQQDLTGDQVHAFALDPKGRGYAQRINADFPAGASVPVYVDPSDSSRSALRVGPHPFTIVFTLLLFPFNAILLGLMLFLWKAREGIDDPLRPWVARDEPDRFILRLVNTSPATVGFMFLGISGFVAFMSILILVGNDPSLELALFAPVACIVLSLLMFAWQRGRTVGGRHDLDFDRRLKRLSLPRGRAMLERPTIRFERVGVEIRPDFNRQVNKKPTWSLRVAESGGQDEFVVRWLSASDARLLGRAIAHECGIRLSVNREPVSQDAGE
ncbi:MAG: DUF3592 domain-containing protein [Planctomycetes bacterium]|nr:DUF3592 domain-containing protein [Planctomycetota bacterium]